MNSRFDDLWGTAANDGASAPLGAFATYQPAETAADVDQLIEAWYRERSDRIECSLVLDEVGRLLSRMLAEGQVPAKRQKRAARLVRMIRELERDRGDGHCS
jgi:hypothetical protein